MANKGGATTQDLNVTGDEANSMPVQIVPNETRLHLPGKAGLLFDQIMANNLSAGEGKKTDGSSGSTGSALQDPMAWSRSAAGNFMPQTSDMSKIGSSMMKGGASG